MNLSLNQSLSAMESWYRKYERIMCGLMSDGKLGTSPLDVPNAGMPTRYPTVFRNLTADDYSMLESLLMGGLALASHMKEFYAPALVEKVGSGNPAFDGIYVLSHIFSPVEYPDGFVRYADRQLLNRYCEFCRTRESISKGEQTLARLHEAEIMNNYLESLAIQRMLKRGPPEGRSHVMEERLWKIWGRLGPENQDAFFDVVNKARKARGKKRLNGLPQTAPTFEMNAGEATGEPAQSYRGHHAIKEPDGKVPTGSSPLDDLPGLLTFAGRRSRI